MSSDDSFRSSEWQKSLCKDSDGRDACQWGWQKVKNEMIPLYRELVKYRCKKGSTGRCKCLKSDLESTELYQWFGQRTSKWQIMLIYCISYIGFGKNLPVDITKAFLGPPRHIKLNTAWKIMKYGLSVTFIFLHLDGIGDSLQIRENKDTILSNLIMIKESPYLSTFLSVEFFMSLGNG